jgi:hypothetical protein
VGDAVFAEFENMLRTANRSDKRHIVDQLADELIIAKVFAEAASQAKKVVLNP